MKLPEFELIQPHSLQEACSILGGQGGKVALLGRKWHCPHGWPSLQTEQTRRCD